MNNVLSEYRNTPIPFFWIMYVFSIIFIEFAFLYALCYWETNKPFIYVLSVGLLLLTGVLYAIHIHLSSDDLQLTDYFFLLFIPLLFGFAIFMLPFTPPDEFTHINRVFDNVTIAPAHTPAQLLDAYQWIGSYKSLGDFLLIDFDYTLVKDSAHIAGGYSKFNYIIPSIIASICKTLNVNGYLIIFFARLSNALIFLIACWHMLRIIPMGKLFLMVFLCNPMLLEQQASCSADSITNTITVLFTIQIFSMNVDFDSHKTKFDFLFLALLACLLFLIKLNYIPLLFLLITLIHFIPNKGMRRSGYALALLCPLILIIVLLKWGKYNSLLFATIGLKEDLNAFSNILPTIREHGLLVLQQLLGGNLGWPYMPESPSPVAVLIPSIWVIYAVLLIISCLFSQNTSCNTGTFDKKNMFIFLFTSLLLSTVIYLALWGANYAVGDPVSGLQGRYFIQPLLLFLLCLASISRTTCSKKTDITLLIISISTSLISLLHCVSFFYHF